jgi:deoxyribodipyrimidine photolyase-related protein
MKIFLLFPINLYKNIDNLDGFNIYMIEESTYFTKYKFHKLKLILHRASMKKYFDYLEKNNITVTYYNYDQNYLKKLENKDVYCYNPIDHDLKNKLINNQKKYNYKITFLESLSFITTNNNLIEYHNKQSNKKFVHSAFYRWQRNRLNILTPINNNGYKLSYDSMNRLKFPDNIKDVFKPKKNNTSYIIEAKQYIGKHFKDNWGNDENFIYPIDFKGAELWLNNFIKTRLKLFGEYEDAIDSSINFGYHSVLSPLLNIGLITDNDVINKILPLQNKIPINSFEGYLRQLIGWKQSMRYLYEFHFDKFDNVNFLNHKNKISKRFWDGNTGIKPIDDCIKKIYNYSYLHHIERLMIMGQFFLLTMVDPKDVFNWYMSLVSIDSYEWVMYPNIYGMIMYGDGGFMMSRPYFSTSNYIKKMSNYNKDKSEIKLSDNNMYKWYEIWDALYYNLINKHYNIFKKQYYMARSTYHWDNKTKEERNKLLEIAKLYLEYL